MDKDRARAFMNTMVGLLNGGALSMMCSIGHRTGLFDTMAGMEPATSSDVAAAAGLNERYVREWLAAMASGGVLDYDIDQRTFHLPDEHATLVTRAGGPLNLANELQFISHLGRVEDDVVDAFTTGHGVPYERYLGFAELMGEQSAARFDAALLDCMIPNIDGAVDALTAGATLADIGCGTGHALLLLATAYPASHFTGYDFSEVALEIARGRADEAGLDNIDFVPGDVAELTADQTFDFVTSFDAIHDQARPADVLRRIHDMLKPGGRYLCVEPKAASALGDNLADPISAYMYTVSTMHCMSVSIAGGGEGLGTAWGTELALEYLAAAGFTDVEIKEVRTDRANTHFVARRPGGE